MNFPDTQYEYTSSEMVPKGEEGETFGNISDYARYAASRHALNLLTASATFDMQQRDRIRWEGERIAYQLSNLRTPRVLTGQSDSGNSFLIEVTDAIELDALTAVNIVSGATRNYVLANSQQTYFLDPRWLYVLGGFLFMMGLVGFCLQTAQFQNRR